MYALGSSPSAGRTRMCPLGSFSRKESENSKESSKGASPSLMLTSWLPSSRSINFVFVPAFFDGAGVVMLSCCGSKDPSFIFKLPSFGTHFSPVEGEGDFVFAATIESTSPSSISVAVAEGANAKKLTLSVEAAKMEIPFF